MASGAGQAENEARTCRGAPDKEAGKATGSGRRLEAGGGWKRKAGGSGRRRGIKTGRRWGAPGEYEVFKISGLRLHNLLGSKRVKLVEGHAFKLNFVDADERVFDAFLGDDAGVDGV